MNQRRDSPQDHAAKSRTGLFAIQPLCIFVALVTLASVSLAQSSRARGSGRPKGATPLTAEDVARRYLPAVVLITCYDERGNTSLASGFFIASGLIVTNYHVIEGMIRGEVKLAASTRRDFTALPIDAILDFDSIRDLALLSVNPTSVPRSGTRPIGVSPEVAEMAELMKQKGPKRVATTQHSTYPPDDPLGIDQFLRNQPLTSLVLSNRSVGVGETIYALGNPEGLEGTISGGIVSSVRESPAGRLLQITSPISAGSSGGPVIDTKGQVVGVVVGSRKEGQNLNFAIPSSNIRKLVPRFLGSEYRFASNATGAWKVPHGLSIP